MSAPIRVCPLCAGVPQGPAFPYATEWDGARFSYVACADCGTTYVDPVPSEEQLARIYTWDAYHGREYATPDPAPYRPTIARLQACRPAPARLLDFGCGGGGLLRAAVEAGYECQGSELDLDVAARVSEATGVPVRPLLELLAAGEQFDVVVLRDVLPHLTDPRGGLLLVEQLLGPGGAVFFDGPLEEQASVVRLVAEGTKGVRHRFGRDVVAAHPPTMLFRVDASAQRRFLGERMGYRERLFEVYETGWPYRVPGRRTADPRLLVKQTIGSVALAVAWAARRIGWQVGNRFYGLYEPVP